MKVKQVLSAIHPFTEVIFETLEGKLIPLKSINADDLEYLINSKVLKITSTDYLKIKILVGNIKCVKSR